MGHSEYPPASFDSFVLGLRDQVSLIFSCAGSKSAAGGICLNFRILFHVEKKSTLLR
jgi:hypothetical protein